MAPPAEVAKMQDAVSALISLGYKNRKSKTVRDVLKNGELSLEDVLRETCGKWGIRLMRVSTTEGLARQSRNRNSDYLPQRRQGRKFQRER
jgi:hypothetical protein